MQSTVTIESLMAILSVLTAIQVAVLSGMLGMLVSIYRRLGRTREEAAADRQRLRSLEIEFRRCRDNDRNDHERLFERVEETEQRLAADDRRLKNLEE